MLKKSFLAIAVMLTLASATTAFAAPKQNDGSVGNYNRTFDRPDDALFDRAKGSID